MNSVKVPIRYLPKALSKTDKKKQAKMLLKSRRLYKQGKYYTRKQLPSYPHKVSQHIRNAQRMYGVEKITPSRELAKATGCSVDALTKIVKKGEGAYFSSGSRPNQTAQSWGLARLGSAVTGGKAAVIDFDILEEGCNHKKRAFTLAKQARKKHGSKLSRTRKILL
jgi:hypothetical protein